ncbi:MAG: tail fiber domain-containing protein [Ferruginibacter sp.]
MKKLLLVCLPAFFTLTAFTQGNVGIGTTTPTYPLDVSGNTARTGNFVNTAASQFYSGVYGSCNNTAGYGTGVKGEGGFIGVFGKSNFIGAGDRFGLYGEGQFGTGSNYGVQGYANGGTTAYGIYGIATGATINWAGYFASGNVYVQNKVGIGTLTPTYPLDVTSITPVTGNFVNTAASQFYSGVYGSCNNTAGYGTGVKGEGGFIGVFGKSNFIGAGDRFGLYGEGQFGAGSNYGVQGYANGGTTAYGIYGIAINGATNWAGYFASGNVYIQNNVGIGTTTPANKLEVVGNTKTTNMQMTSGATNNFVLKSDASGNASWVNPTTLAITETDPKVGSLTTSRVPKWNGTTLTSGLIFDDGTNVGIGTTTPAYPLEVISSTLRTGQFVNTAAAADNFGVYSLCANTAGFGYGVYGQGGKVGVQGNATVSGVGDRTGLYGVGQFGAGSNHGVRGQAFGGTTAMGIYGTASGATTNWAGYFESGNVYIQNNVGIGTSNPLQTIDVNGRMNITNGVIQRGGIAITATSDLGLYSRIAGNYIRLVTNAAPIRFFSDDNIGTNANVTIEANGNVGIGTISPSNKFHVSGATSSNSVVQMQNTFGGPAADGLYIQAGDNATAGSYLIWFKRPDGIPIGLIGQTSAAGIAYNTTSDSRLKNIIGVSQKGLSDLLKIKIYDYTFKSDMSKKVQSGFMAQELYDIFPQSVSKPRDNNETAEKNPWMVDYGSITPLIIKAVQEQEVIITNQNKKIEDMQKQIDELKALMKK